jgi:hypothetical protein
MARSHKRVLLAGAVMALGMGMSFAQQAAAPGADDPLLKKKPIAPIGQQAPKPAAAPKVEAKPAAAQNAPAKVPAANVAAKPAPAKAPAAAVAQKPASTPKPGAGNPASVANAVMKVSPAARRAAHLAVMTAQPTPPQHDHVSLPYQGTCANPDAIGVSRTLEVDTTGGLYLGQLYSGKLPLQDKEVVLTFDDGPVPRGTERVLAALEAECTKATFFIVGSMAKAYPETLRKTAAAGHTIGYHTMTHPLDLVKRPVEWGKENFSSGWKVVDEILYGKAEDLPANSFVRYPGLFNSPGVNAWFNGMDIGVFAIDAAGNDWLKGYLTAKDAPNVMNEALKELEKTNGGILLLHDIKESSSNAVAPLLRELKARGFKIVQIVPKRRPPPLIAAVDSHFTASIPDQSPAPLAERNFAGYDTNRQLGQEARGFQGQTSMAPLPKAPGQPVASLKSAAPAAAANGQSIADVIGQADPATAPDQAVAAAPVKTAESSSWLAVTERSFHGIASAIGLW